MRQDRQPQGPTSAVVSPAVNGPPLRRSVMLKVVPTCTRRRYVCRSNRRLIRRVGSGRRRDRPSVAQPLATRLGVPFAGEPGAVHGRPAYGRFVAADLGPGMGDTAFVDPASRTRSSPGRRTTPPAPRRSFG